MKGLDWSVVAACTIAALLGFFGGAVWAGERCPALSVAPGDTVYVAPVATASPGPDYVPGESYRALHADYLEARGRLDCVRTLYPSGSLTQARHECFP